MAKKHNEDAVTPTAVSTMFDVSKVFALGKLNSRKDYGSVESLVESFLLQGRWLIQEPATAERIDRMDYLLGQPEAEGITAFPEAVRGYLQTEWTRLLVIQKEKPSAETKAHLDAFEWIHVKDDAIVQPELMIVDANRRMLAYPQAVAKAFLEPWNEATQTGYKLPGRDVPVIVETFQSIEQRLHEQVRINDYGSEGKKEMTFEERFNVALRLRKLGYGQTEYRKMFGETAGQQVWYWILLDRAFPKEEIAKRLLLPATGSGKDENAIVARKVKYVPELASRCGVKGAKPLDQYNKTKFKDRKEEYVDALDEVGLHDYLITVAGPNAKGRPGSDTKKIMDRKQIDNLWEEHRDERIDGNHMVGMVAEAILENDRNLLGKAVAVSQGMNTLLYFHETGGYPEVEQLLLKIRNTPKDERGHFIKALLEAASEIAV